MQAWADTHCTFTHSHWVCLFGSCPRPCYKISLGKQQGPWTGHRERNAERKSDGDRWGRIKFHCLFARASLTHSIPLLSIHPRFTIHPPFLFSFFRNQEKPSQSLPGQGSMSVILKSPYPFMLDLAVLETNWPYMNNHQCFRTQSSKKGLNAALLILIFYTPQTQDSAVIRDRKEKQQKDWRTSRNKQPSLSRKSWLNEQWCGKLNTDKLLAHHAEVSHILLGIKSSTLQETGKGEYS